MGLLDMVKSAFGRTPEDQRVGTQERDEEGKGVSDEIKATLHPKVQEEITAFLQPRELVEKDGCIRLNEAEEFFDRHMNALEQAIAEAYGTSFTLVREWRDGTLVKKQNGIYTFESKKEGIVIKYNASCRGMEMPYGLDKSYEPDGSISRINPAFYHGRLTIREERVDLQKAGALLRSLLSRGFLLGYKGRGSDSRVGWSISHDKGAEPLGEGKELLKKMNVPVEKNPRYLKTYM